MVTRISLKAYLQGEGIRRISVDPSDIVDFDYVKQRILGLFKLPLDTSVEVCWKDGEGDLIKISTNEELIDAVKNRSKDNVLRLYFANRDKDSVCSQFPLVVQTSADNPSIQTTSGTPSMSMPLFYGPIRGWRGSPRCTRKWMQHQFGHNGKYP